MLVTVPIAGPRKRLPRLKREQQLLDIAEELFTTRGYADTSIEDIARGAGVTRPVVYELHGNKEAVFLACVRRGRATLEQEISLAVAGKVEPLAQLRAGFHTYYSVLERDPQRWALLFGPSGPSVGGLSEELSQLRFGTVDLIVELLARNAPGASRLDLEACAHSVSGSAEQLGRWWRRSHPELGRAQIVDYQVELVWRGIGHLFPGAAT